MDRNTNQRGGVDADSFARHNQGGSNNHKEAAKMIRSPESILDLAEDLIQAIRKFLEQIKKKGAK